MWRHPVVDMLVIRVNLVRWHAPTSRCAPRQEAMMLSFKARHPSAAPHHRPPRNPRPAMAAVIATATLGAATIVGVTAATADGASPPLYENSHASAPARAADLAGRMTL